MGTVKSSIGNINRGISEIKSALVSRCDKVDQAVGTDTIFLEEVKSDPGTGDEGHHMMVPREYQESPERRDDNLSGLSSLNTSEVQFKPSAAFLTYHKERLRAKRSIGEVGPLDSEIDAIPDTESHLKKKRMGQRFVYDTQTQPSEDKETQETDYTQERNHRKTLDYPRNNQDILRRILDRPRRILDRPRRIPGRPSRMQDTPRRMQDPPRMNQDPPMRIQD